MVIHEDGRMYPHDADNAAPIYEDEHGHLWVTHEDLLACGYRMIEDFDVVYLNGTFYELQSHQRKPNAWWVEEVELLDETESKQIEEAAETEPETS